ncbi:MAG TPA: PHB depolymerase family esterase [Thermoanaerobaculia bacterium]
MFRLLMLLLSLCALACTATMSGPQVTDFAPLSVAASDELSRQIKTLSETVKVDAYEANVFVAPDGRSLPYRLLRPAANPTNHPRRLVVMFHGSGAIGTDNRSQVGALAKSWATDDVQRRFGAYVLVPQFPTRSSNYKIGPDALPYSEGTELLGTAAALVQHIRATEQIPPENTYAIGFSMGGSAIWNVLRDHPGLFARAAIVGGVPPADAARVAGRTPLLLVHGDADTENPFAAAWNVFLNAHGPLEFWRFRGLEHDFPPELITTDRLREWLFTERR